MDGRKPENNKYNDGTPITLITERIPMVEYDNPVIAGIAMMLLL